MIGRSAIIVYRKPMPAAAISTNSLLTAGSRTCCAASRHCAAQLRYKALLKGSPFLAEKPVGNPQRAVLAPIQAFSRRPLSPGYRPLTGPSLKGSNGSAPADVSRTAKWLLLPHSSHCQTPARGFAGLSRLSPGQPRRTALWSRAAQIIRLRRPSSNLI